MHAIMLKKCQSISLKQSIFDIVKCGKKIVLFITNILQLLIEITLIIFTSFSRGMIPNSQQLYLWACILYTYDMLV